MDKDEYKDLSQTESIDRYLKRSEEQRIRSEKIQRLYEEYRESKKELTFEKLVKEMDDYCIDWVRKQLWIVGKYFSYNETIILNNAHLVVWRSILKDVDQDIKKDYFVKHMFVIYRNCTREFLRVENKKKKYEISLDAPIDEDGESRKHLIPVKTVEDVYEFREKEEMYKNLFVGYCRGFMESNAFLPRALALYYARVLPHFLNEIPDTKVKSAKWAYERMDSKTVLYLKSDSESFLKKYIHEILCWGDEFLCQLEKSYMIDGKTYVLKDLVYTSVYDKGKIEDWAESMHETAIKKAMYFIIEDSNLLTLARSYISKSNELYQMIKGGKKK